MLKNLLLLLYLLLLGSTTSGQNINYVIDDNGKALMPDYFEQNLAENASDQFVSKKGDSPFTELNQNLFSLNLFGFAVEYLSIGYERIHKNGNVGFKFYHAYGYTNNLEEEYNLQWLVGFDIKYYRVKRERFLYAMGTYSQIGEKRFLHEYTVDGDVFFRVKGKPFYAVGLNNSFLFRITSRVNLSVDLGLGITDITYGEQVKLHSNFGINAIVAF
jgi:hypothetical protein